MYFFFCTRIRMLTTLLIFSLLMSGQWAESARILFLTPYSAPSHSSFFKPVVAELARRGHAITYWNGLESKVQVENVTHLYSERLRPLNSNYPVTFGDSSSLSLMLMLPSKQVEICQLVYTDPILKRLMGEKFDLVVLEAFLNECMLPVAQYFKVPFIYMNAVFPLPWLLDAIGSPMALDQVPLLTTTFTHNMNLFERVHNTIEAIIMVQFRDWFVLPKVDYMARQLLQQVDRPNAKETEKNVSLIITNTHLSINYQLPKTAVLVEVGGLHCVPSKALPQDLENFINEVDDAGFIMLSFGSIVRGADMPEKTRNIFASTFSRLRQRVLWKWEDEIHVPNVSSNVKLMSWLPQQDLLGHRKIKLFITHGGLFSNQEAVHHGVPLIGLPVYADQFSNVKRAEQDGYAIFLNWETLTEEILYDAIQRVLLDPKYKMNIDRVSHLMLDRMEHPLDQAVYSIEYVIRHGGAAHLRTGSRQLEPYQRAMLDVIFVVACLVLLVACAIVMIIRRLLSWHKYADKTKKDQ